MSKFIMEQAIFQEAESVKFTPRKAYFRMVLQTVNEKNQNKRFYPEKVVLEALNECRPRMMRRSFYGELDGKMVIYAVVNIVLPGKISEVIQIPPLYLNKNRSYIDFTIIVYPITLKIKYPIYSPIMKCVTLD